MIDQDWIVKTKRGIKPGDVVAVLYTPLNTGIVTPEVVKGVVASITRNHVVLHMDGEEYSVHADSVFATPPPA